MEKRERVGGRKVEGGKAKWSCPRSISSCPVSRARRTVSDKTTSSQKAGGGFRSVPGRSMAPRVDDRQDRVARERLSECHVRAELLWRVRHLEKITSQKCAAVPRRARI